MTEEVQLLEDLIRLEDDYKCSGSKDTLDKIQTLEGAMAQVLRKKEQRIKNEDIVSRSRRNSDN